MGYGDYYWGFSRDYYRDPFPHSLLSTRQFFSSLHRGVFTFRAEVPQARVSVLGFNIDLLGLRKRVMQSLFSYCSLPNWCLLPHWCLQLGSNWATNLSRTGNY